MKKYYSFLFLMFFAHQIIFSQASNYSLSFDGSNSYVSVPQGILNNPEAFTIEAWIKPKIINANVVPIYCQGATGFIFFELSGNLGYFKLQLQLDDGTSNGLWIGVGSNTSLVEDIWQHVAVEFNKSAGRISVYLNGKLVGQNQIPTQYYPRSLGFPSQIGKYPDLSQPGYNGLIDGIKISNIERYNSDFLPPLDFQNDSNTLALWKFNEGVGTVANDESGHGFNGQIVGATYSTETSFNSLNLLSPNNNSANAPLNFAVDWSFPSNANFYKVQVATDSSFNNVVVENDNILDKKYFISGLSAGHTYYWRVKANTPWGETPWTIPWKFNTKSSESNFSLYLDGVSNYVQLPGSLIAPNPDQFTIETWVKPLPYTYNPPPPLFYTAQSAEFSLTVGGPNNFAGLAVNTTDLPDGKWYGVGIAPTIVPNKWYHIAATYDRIIGKMRVYVDGKFVSENSVSNNYLIQRPNTFVSYIGRYLSGNEYFKGLVDNIRISNNIRYTTDFVPQLDFGNDQNTLGLWRFNESDGNVTYDESKNGNHGKIIGATYSNETALNSLSLELPADSSQNAPLALGLRWNFVGQVISYHLQVSLSQNFTQNVVDLNDVNQNNYYISNLNAGSTYYWRVKANTLWGETPWTQAWKFVTATQENNYSLSFDGVDDYVELPNDLIQTTPGEFTIEAWVKPFYNIDNPNFNWNDFFYQGSTGEFSFGINQNNLSVYLAVDLNVSGIQQWNGVTSSKSLVAGQWSHIAGTFNSSTKTISIFINGKLSGVRQIPSVELWQTGGNLKTRIGLYGDPNNNRTHYKGDADEVRLSNTVRYNGDFNPQIDFQTDSQTIGLWKFNEGSGNTVYDASTKGNHGQIVSATYSSDSPVPLPPLSEILVHYECNMEIEILGGRFNPSSDYVELRGGDFGWGPGVTMQQDSNNRNIYYYEATQSLRLGDKLPDYKYWYLSFGHGTWEDGENRTYQMTQQDFDNGKIVIKRMFNDLTFDQLTNSPTEILMEVDTKGGHDVWSNPLPNQINTLHLTGSTLPLSWSGWMDNTSAEMMPMYDDGTHGDLAASDGVYSNTLTFNAYSPLKTQYAYVINFVPNGFIPYENPAGDNHIFNLEQNLVSATVNNVYGIMSSVTGITPLADKVYTIKYENTTAQTSLQNLSTTTTGETQQIVTDALNSFTDSQNPKYWVDDSHLSDQGQKVFEATKQSVEDLMKLKTDVGTTNQALKSVGPNVLDIITHIYNADRNIVVTYLNESKTKFNQKGCGDNAKNNDCKKIKKRLDDSDQSITQAKEKYDKAEYSKSIEELKKGWQSLRDITKEKLFKSGETDNNDIIPTEFSMTQNYPNPFNPTTQIQFGLPVDSRVSLKVYDILGREVAELADGVYSAGVYTFTFDASRLSSGVYIYQLNADGINGKSFNQLKKLILMK
ncbi:MAG: T9SS type A sorting domain-containing protein [Bacteroidetes bacterium]|nr:T9SS type A sorting domain-containing protein [Bacteroidota bacterium]